MKHFRILTIFLTSLLFVSALPGQNQDPARDIERQLNRLETKIQEARHLMNLLGDTDLRNFVQQATVAKNQARNAFGSKHYLVAANQIKLAYSYLAQFYLKLKNNERFRQRFRERLDQKIQEAEQRVSQSQNTEAAKLLNRSKYYRQRAFQTFRNDQPEAMFRNYFVATFFAESALRVATGQDVRNTGDFNRYLENSKELYNQVDELAGPGANKTINRILRNAREELGNVQKLYDQNLNKQAFQKLQIVNRFLYRALNLIESSPASMSERLDIDLQLLEERISELGSEVQASQDEQIRKIYERSLFLTSSAREKNSSQDYAGARQQISLANRLLYQIHQRLNRNGEPRQNQLKNQLETAEMMLQSLKQEKIEDPAYASLIQLLESNYRQAKQQLENGNQNMALVHLRFFNGLAIKSNQLRTKFNLQGQQEQQIENSLNRLQTMLENVPSEVEQDVTMQAKYNNASRLYNIARDACNKGNYEVCNQISRLAINVLTQ
jgi:hypothetical protein